MKIKDILSLCDLTNTELGELEVTKLTHETEAITEGTLFFDLPHTDKRQRAARTLGIKPLAIVCEAESEYLKLSLPIIKVNNARRAYACACYNFFKFERQRVRLVGVTGTCGKTTTATLIYKMAVASGLLCGFIGTGKIELNGKKLSDELYSMTTPDPDLLYKTLKEMTDCGAELIVMEVSSHALYLDKLAPLHFDIGIFTGLSPEHLDFHKTMDEYFRAKELLIQKSTLGIICTLDEYGKRMYGTYRSKSLSVGRSEDSDAYITEPVQRGLLKTVFAIKMGEYRSNITTNLTGDYNEINILLALCCVRALGLESSVCESTLRQVYIDGRINITKDSGITVIKDFAHTPLALEKLLNLANSTKVSGQKVTIVFGCGGERDALKRPVMAEIASKLSDRAIITSDNPRNERKGKILSDMLFGCDMKCLIVILDRREAIEYAITTADDGDVVIIAGKGHEKYIIENNGATYFSEDEIIRCALEKRKRS